MTLPKFGDWVSYFYDPSLAPVRGRLICHLPHLDGWALASIEGALFDVSNADFESGLACVLPPSGCNHTFAEYVGLTTRFHYCTKCDEKRV